MEKLVSRQTAARMLGLAPQTLAKWSMTGKNLPVIRIGSRTVRYSYADVLAFIQQNKTVNRNTILEMKGVSYE
jgi:predicted DNA-binding transcriptional regulator AlpA